MSGKILIIVTCSRTNTHRANSYTIYTTIKHSNHFHYFINIEHNTKFNSISKKEDTFEGFNKTRFKKIASMFFGFRVKKPKYGFTIIKIVKGKKKLQLGLHNGDKDEFSEKRTF